jgi:hypothetical protein
MGGDIGGSSGTAGAADSVGTGGSGGSAGTTGAYCGASFAACPQGQGCLRECFGDSDHGRCVALPTACDASLAAVCGCDAKTYINDCFLQSVPMVKDHDGACLVAPGEGAGDVLLPGIWSGPGIRMNVTATGAAISFGCASGTIDQPLSIARRFYTVAGPLTWVGYWQGTLSGADGGVAPAGVTYQADLFTDSLRLQVMDQSWTLQYQDVGPPACP